MFKKGNQFAKGNPPNKTSFKKGHPAPKTAFQEGHTPWLKGKHIQTNTGKTHFRKGSKVNLGRKRPDMKGNKYAWKNGKSREPYAVDWNETLKRAIRERDNYICQICSQYGNLVHHKDYNKKNCAPDDLITLCHKCHSKTNYNRQY